MPKSSAEKPKDANEAARRGLDRLGRAVEKQQDKEKGDKR